MELTNLLPSPLSQECARMIDYNHQLRLDSGLVFAVPIPDRYVADADGECLAWCVSVSCLLTGGRLWLDRN
jgi:hypothetical protein